MKAVVSLTAAVLALAACQANVAQVHPTKPTMPPALAIEPSRNVTRLAVVRWEAYPDPIRTTATLAKNQAPFDFTMKLPNEGHCDGRTWQTPATHGTPQGLWQLICDRADANGTMEFFGRGKGFLAQGRDANGRSIEIIVAGEDTPLF